MNRDNVFPFQASPRAALRRGAPDKSPAPRSRVDVECPICDAPLPMETREFAPPDLFCESCRTNFSLFREEAAAD